MVFGILAGLGVLTAGIGIFKGSSSVGNAADNVANNIGRAVESIENDVKELKTYFINEIGPQVTEVLLKSQQLLDRFKVLSYRAEKFIITATVATKIFALTFLLSAALICKYLEWAIEREYAHPAGFRKRRFVAFKPEKIIIQIVYCICLSMALVLALHLVSEISQITWPLEFPIVIIIPSIATLSMYIQHILRILKEIFKLAKQLLYRVFGLHIELVKYPVTSGYTYYSNCSVPLSMVVACVILPLYSFALAFLLLVIEHIFERKFTPFQIVLASYVIFISTALVVRVIWMMFHRALVRPMWAFMARRKFH